MGFTQGIDHFLRKHFWLAFAGVMALQLLALILLLADVGSPLLLYQGY